MRKRDQEENHDSSDHIHQHENTTIVSRHKPEDQIKIDKMLHNGQHYSMEQRHGQLPNLCCLVLMLLRCGYIEEY